VGAKAAVAVATATLVAAGAADIHKVTTHHRHAHPVAHVAPAVRVPVAISAGTAQRGIPIVHHTAPASTKDEHTQHQQPAADNGAGTTGSSTTSSDALPATQGGGSGTFPDTPAPPSTTDAPAGHDTPPTDPASQPIGAKEPVQVQGFDPGSGSGDGSTNSP
jgi:hypothetical protein